MSSSRGRRPLAARAWTALLTGLHRRLTRLGRVKRLFPSRLKDRIKAWLLWKAYAGPLGRSRKGASKRPSRALEPGVNLFGYFEMPTGLGEGARAALSSAQAAGIPTARISFTEDDLDAGFIEPERLAGELARARYSVNWCHVNPSHSGQLVACFGPEVFADRLNVGYWVWELDSLPRMWAVSYRYYDEIWTPSEFSRRAIEKRSPVPVRVVPHALELEPPPGDWRAHFGIPADRPAFLVMFDMGSTSERKNPVGAVRAFRAAAPLAREAVLVVKTWRSSEDPRAFETLRRELDGLDAVLIDECLPRRETLGLLSACDCLVSLHRAEGFGLVPAQAMAFGKAVIATNYSGTAEYMTAANSFPVRFEMTSITRPVGPYAAGGLWAEPDIAHAAEMIRECIARAELVRAKGQRARADMRRFSHEAVGRIIRCRLEELGIVLPAGCPATRQSGPNDPERP